MQLTSKPQYSPRFETAQECIEELRERATAAAVKLIRPQIMSTHGWKNKRPSDEARQANRLDLICTCIEVLTVNGNYSWERSQALARAKHQESHRGN